MCILRDILLRTAVLLIISGCSTLSLPNIVYTADPATSGSSAVNTAASGQQAPQLAPPKSEWSFPEGVKEDMELAFKGYAEDPVSTYLLLKQIREGHAKPDSKLKLSEDQIQWLEADLLAIKPYVVALLEKDKAEALRKSDVRSAFFSTVVLLRVQETSDLATQIKHVSAPAGLLHKLLKDQKHPNPVWEVSDVTGEILAGSLTDRGWTISPDAGQKLLEVRAKARNVSGECDVSYAHWSSYGLPDGWDPTIDRWQEKAGDTTKRRVPYRFMGYPCILLLIGNDPLGACTYVYDDCEVVWGNGWGGFILATMMATMDKSLRFPSSNATMEYFCMGSNVGKGTSCDLHLLFSVPETLTAPPRLLILGSDPVPVNMTK